MTLPSRTHASKKGQPPQSKIVEPSTPVALVKTSLGIHLTSKRNKKTANHGSAFLQKAGTTNPFNRTISDMPNYQNDATQSDLSTVNY
ncbi:hypothetical protein KEM48_001201 [Puccinia striiformis f. sp. tritici PST-130]|uniref:Uncharacterized protein n=1 Tax=Puccinia striiformis f. sp. tritici PST-78 TaxID=1165861 RepID=A0A0L0V988_9BASI|nr:hypothetical protein KEM48_001201 [Puccinia striiformis f. sp. tritici PST-130]KNE95539.1 hypothetical protein PSTG_11144 [Puccinia striiformis f. sp. tritici PST-78]